MRGVMGWKIRRHIFRLMDANCSYGLVRLRADPRKRSPIGSVKAMRKTLIRLPMSLYSCAHVALVFQIWCGCRCFSSPQFHAASGRTLPLGFQISIFDPVKCSSPFNFVFPTDHYDSDGENDAQIEGLEASYRGKMPSEFKKCAILTIVSSTSDLLQCSAPCRRSCVRKAEIFS